MDDGDGRAAVASGAGRKWESYVLKAEGGRMGYKT
mgnify:CR=1 FL=1